MCSETTKGVVSSNTENQQKGTAGGLFSTNSWAIEPCNNHGDSGKHQQIDNVTSTGSICISTWWLIPLSKWVRIPVINGISRVNPLIVCFALSYACHLKSSFLAAVVYSLLLMITSNMSPSSCTKEREIAQNFDAEWMNIQIASYGSHDPKKEIDGLPNLKMVIFYSYAKLPEGNQRHQMDDDGRGLHYPLYLRFSFHSLWETGNRINVLIFVSIYNPEKLSKTHQKTIKPCRTTGFFQDFSHVPPLLHLHPQRVRHTPPQRVRRTAAFDRAAVTAAEGVQANGGKEL